MSITQKIPLRSLPIQPFNMFTANFNNPVGQYGFTQVAGNALQTVINLRKEYIYLIERVFFSASIPEGVFLESVDNTTPLPASPATTPNYCLYLLKSKHSILSRRAAAVNYKDNTELNIWFFTANANDQLLITFQGVLNQVAATVGIAAVYAQVSFVIYEIAATIAVKKMIEAIDPSFANFYKKG